MTDTSQMKDNPEYRRDFVKGLTCNHKHFDIHECIYICDKNDKECLVEGCCPKI